MRKMGAVSMHQKLWTVVDVSSLAEAMLCVSEKSYGEDRGVDLIN